MSLSEQYNVGARIKTVAGSSNLAISQTSGTAATTQDGLAINRAILGRRYYSCKASAAFGYVAASTATTATINVRIQDSTDGNTWGNYTTGTAVSFGNSTAGTTDYKTVECSANLNGAKQYIRAQVTAPVYATSSSGQGVFSGQVQIVFGGGDELPAA